MSPRRRVLYLGVLPPHPGGAAMWAGGLIPRLSARGHEIAAIAPIPEGVAHDDSRLGEAGVVVQRYGVPYFDTDPFANTDRAFYERQTRDLLDRASPLIRSGWAEAVLIGHETFIPSIPDLARRAGIPTIATVHTIYWTGDERRRQVNFGPGGTFENLGACDQIVCVARHAEAALASLGLTSVTTIHNAVDLEMFCPRPRPLGIAAALGVPADACVVSHVANLKPIKQAWRLVEAAPRILERYPETTVLLLGQGPCEADLRARRCSLDLEERVRFLGWVDHALLPEYYALSDVMALPSASEGAPFACLEALACGCAVVSTPIAAARELLTGIPGAFIARSHEPPDIADAVCHALAYARDGERRATTARAAAARFDVRDAVARFSALIDAAQCRS